MDKNGQVFKQLRLQTGLTQRDFAVKMRIPVGTYEQWETGRRFPPPYVYEMMKYIIDAEIQAQIDMDNNSGADSDNESINESNSDNVVELNGAMSVEVTEGKVVILFGERSAHQRKASLDNSRDCTDEQYRGE